MIDLQEMKNKGRYKRAEELYASKSILDIEEAEKLFRKLDDYEDSRKRRVECRKKIKRVSSQKVKKLGLFWIIFTLVVSAVIYKKSGEMLNNKSNEVEEDTDKAYEHKCDYDGCNEEGIYHHDPYGRDKWYCEEHIQYVEEKDENGNYVDHNNYNRKSYYYDDDDYDYDDDYDDDYDYDYDDDYNYDDDY